MFLNENVYSSFGVLCFVAAVNRATVRVPGAIQVSKAVIQSCHPSENRPEPNRLNFVFTLNEPSTTPSRKNIKLKSANESWTYALSISDTSYNQNMALLWRITRFQMVSFNAVFDSQGVASRDRAGGRSALASCINRITTSLPIFLNHPPHGTHKYSIRQAHLGR